MAVRLSGAHEGLPYIGSLTLARAASGGLRKVLEGHSPHYARIFFNFLGDDSYFLA